MRAFLLRRPHVLYHFTTFHRLPLLISARYTSQQAASSLASRGHPCADRGLIKKKLQLIVSEVARSTKVLKPKHPAAGGTTPSPPSSAAPEGVLCGLTPQLDVFAQSRLSNYAKRISSQPMEKTIRTVQLVSPSATAVPRHLMRVELLVPVDLLLKGKLERSHVLAIGMAATEREALIAASMHAERCLDALSIPLFSAESRQQKRVEELRKDGRWAPQVQDPPAELGEVVLPPPVCFVPLLHPTGDTSSSSGEQRCQLLAGEKPFQPASSHARPTSRRQRSRDFARRFGSEPLQNSSFKEMEDLYHTILQHQATSSGEEEDEDIPVSIEAGEVEILQPSTAVSSHDDTSSALRSARPSAPPSLPRYSPGSTSFVGAATQENSLARSYYIPSHYPCSDETEGGQFKLVDASIDKWLPEEKNAIAVCIRDPTVHRRLKEYFERMEQRRSEEAAAATSPLTFESIVQVSVAEADTNVQEKGRWKTVQLKWYTASAEVPGLESERPVLAIGKGTTLEIAHDLCAMHMEEILNFVGVPLSDCPEKQVEQFDGCLRWGRFAAPEPIAVGQAEASPAFPRPNKEWYCPRKNRMRVSLMTVTEKLQALNRRVVSQYRQHHIEVDVMHKRELDEVLRQSPECLREFMRAQRHPFECAIMNFHLSLQEYRASVYLPLPPAYGVRGGCAVGRTQEMAYHLCAMNALDVLFALDCVPMELLQKTRWQTYLKERDTLGLLVPLSYRRLRDGDGAMNLPFLKPSPTLRSPPGIRDAPSGWCSEIPPSHEIWQVLMTNAEDFDVAPNPTHIPEMQSFEVTRLMRHLFARFVAKAEREGRAVKCAPPKNESLEAVPFKRCVNADLGAPLKCFRHYCGYQHLNGMRRVRANNCWWELPLDPAVYGRRIAYGRCISRNGAERAFFIHAFRILRLLRLAPWDELSESELLQTIYNYDQRAMKRECDFWRVLVQHVIDPAADGSMGDAGVQESSAGLRQHKRRNEVRAAELVGPEKSAGSKAAGEPARAFDLRAPSPNPVMTTQLAALTFF